MMNAANATAKQMRDELDRLVEVAREIAPDVSFRVRAERDFTARRSSMSKAEIAKCLKRAQDAIATGDANLGGFAAEVAASQELGLSPR